MAQRDVQREPGRHKQDAISAFLPVCSPIGWGDSLRPGDWMSRFKQSPEQLQRKPVQRRDKLLLCPKAACERGSPNSLSNSEVGGFYFYFIQLLYKETEIGGLNKMCSQSLQVPRVSSTSKAVLLLS